MNFLPLMRQGAFSFPDLRRRRRSPSSDVASVRGPGLKAPRWLPPRGSSSVGVASGAQAADASYYDGSSKRASRGQLLGG